MQFYTSYVKTSYVKRLRKALTKTRLTVAKNVPVTGFVNIIRQKGTTIHRVDIAYASTVPYKYMDRLTLRNYGRHAEHICRFMMITQYASALKYAVDNGTRSVFL